jgi:hypothetical protein
MLTVSWEEGFTLRFMNPYELPYEKRGLHQDS